MCVCVLDLHLSYGIGSADYELNDGAFGFLEHLKVLRTEVVSLGGLRYLLIKIDVMLEEHV